MMITTTTKHDEERSSSKIMVKMTSLHTLTFSKLVDGVMCVGSGV